MGLRAIELAGSALALLPPCCSCAAASLPQISVPLHHAMFPMLSLSFWVCFQLFHSASYTYIPGEMYRKLHKMPWDLVPGIVVKRYMANCLTMQYFVQRHLPWSHGQCDLDTEHCYLPIEVVPIYLLVFACFLTARLAGAGTSDEHSLRCLDSVSYTHLTLPTKA